MMSLETRKFYFLKGCYVKPYCRNAQAEEQISITFETLRDDENDKVDIMG